MGPELKEVLSEIQTVNTEWRAKFDALEAQVAAGAADAVTKGEFETLDGRLTELLDLRKKLEDMEREVGAIHAARDVRARAGELSAEQKEHYAAFEDWIRDPINGTKAARLKAAEGDTIVKIGRREHRLKEVLIGTPAAGGYAVPEVISTAIHAKIVDISPIRSIARVVMAGTSDYKELVDVAGEAYGWVGEGDTRSETATAQLAEVAPTFGIIYAYPKASEESLDDIFFDVEAWLIDRSARAHAKGEGIAFISGDGTKKPTGFLAGTPVAIGDEASPARAFGTLQYFPTGNATGFQPSRVDSPAGDPADVFMSAIYGLKAGYRANARWVANKATLGAMRKFKNADGDYLWQPNLIMGQPDMFAGYPITEAEDMPDLAGNAFPVAFGDFMEGYLIVDLFGMRVTRDEVTTPGFVKFYVRKRVGGKLLNDDAIKLIKCATS